MKLTYSESAHCSKQGQSCLLLRLGLSSRDLPHHLPLDAFLTTNDRDWNRKLLHAKQKLQQTMASP